MKESVRGMNFSTPQVFIYPIFPQNYNYEKISKLISKPGGVSSCLGFAVHFKKHFLKTMLLPSWKNDRALVIFSLKKDISKLSNELGHINENKMIDINKYSFFMRQLLNFLRVYQNIYQLHIFLPNLCLTFWLPLHSSAPPLFSQDTAKQGMPSYQKSM